MMREQAIASRPVDLGPEHQEDRRCEGASLRRASLRVRGVVQGVGFRPFIYHLARKHGLTGWVCNRSGDVKIEVEGTEEALNGFLVALKETPPPRAQMEELILAYSQATGYEDFEIRKSVSQSGTCQLISNDISTCAQCLAEVFDPRDRRHGYAFTNCTNCGPRFTILEDIPYDRPKTAMRSFPMCPQCQEEYEDPLNRRFHAQPNACPACGPELALVDPENRPILSDDLIGEAAHLLKEGNILALKGLGGFLLVCDATSGQAVRRLRERKNRPSKPLATMMATVEEIRRFCHLSGEEKELIASPESPIVLLKIKRLAPIRPEVAPNLNTLGVMLPYTPLHHLLLRRVNRPLVMTSGNVSGQPIVKDNPDALERLGKFADAFLLHNRDIISSCDDSVTVVEEGKRHVWRMARGYTPKAIPIGFKGDPVLACGADLKNTFCITRDGLAFLSPHIGDMEDLVTQEHFEQTLALYKRLFRVDPRFIAHDAHPDYLITQFAKRMKEAYHDVKLVPVQHHHAHIVSCMAEHRVSGPILGVAFDGTGYGEDRHIWGGEFLSVEYGRFRRLGHLEYLPMPGGAGAVRKPYRMALGYLLALLGEEALADYLSPVKRSGRTEIAILRKQIRARLNAPLTSSAGRLFDAVSALLGVREEVSYEAQAAIELEAVAKEQEHGDRPYPFEIDREGGLWVVRLVRIFQGILRDLSDGTSTSEISSKFHQTMARVVLQMSEGLREETGIESVALSGGVFQNRLFHRLSRQYLAASGFQVYSNEQVPCNDGGLALGQALIAASLVKKE